MSLSIICGVVAAAVSIAALARVVVVGRKRARTLDEIAERILRDLHPRVDGERVTLEHHADFAYYDYAGCHQVPHLVAMAAQDLIWEAEANHCEITGFPQVAVDAEEKKIHAFLSVVRPKAGAAAQGQETNSITEGDEK